MKTTVRLLVMLFLIVESSTAQVRFNRYAIGKAGERVPGLCVSDIDLDGDLEIIAGADVLSNPGSSSALTIYENTKIQTGISMDLMPPAGWFAERYFKKRRSCRNLPLTWILYSQAKGYL